MERRTEDEKRKNTLDWNDINATKPATSFGLPVQDNSFGQNEQREQIEQFGQSEAGLLNVKPAEKPEPQLPNAYDELLNTYKSRLEQEEKMAKARRGRAAINGIADMGRAIANLIATSQYAPNAYDPSQSLSASAQARYEKAKAERDKSRAEWMNYALKKKKLFDDVRNHKLKRDQYKLEVEKEERRKAETKIREMRADVAAGVLDIREAELEIKRMLAEHKISDDEAKREIDRMRLNIARTNANTASRKVDLAEQGSTTETSEETIDPVTRLPKKKTVKKTTKPAGNKPKINY